ncbi:hypothetical protein [Ichthyenterobacterium magnum]|uniref:Glycerophosphoryl diester phosphodiesterase family protein n=1 Tax=Ichthyenterobacterium magnum TaxID=1230530 RepID=A0A420DGM7_9FLAO|nr:hypothetical protein [Ichthyenterobacterium magnum]RKE92245.1 hypothetical protein BXY80_2163 [Ichthyenterobacterium magnum]
MKKFIELKKQREFGDILADTFAFLRSEFKPLLKTITNIAGPYIVLFLIALVFYIYIVGDQFSFDLNSDVFPYQNPLAMVAAYLLYLVAAILAYTFTTSATLFYIKSYTDNQGQVDVNEIKQNVNKTFWSFLGLSFLKGLTLFVAVLICCLPVFYAIVPMAIVLPILVFKSMNATDAYSEGFTLIKDEFWITLATLIVLYIIISVIGSIIAVPTVIYTWLKMGVFSGEVDPSNLDSLVDPVYIFLNVLSSFFQYALNIVVVVGSAFIYFNLNERKHFSGTLERINTLGNSDN